MGFRSAGSRSSIHTVKTWSFFLLSHYSTFLCLNSLSVGSFSHLLTTSHPRERVFLILVVPAKAQGYVSSVFHRSHDYSQTNYCAMKSNALISQTWVVYPLLEVETGMKAILTKTIRALKEKKPKLSLLTCQKKEHMYTSQEIRDIVH